MYESGTRNARYKLCAYRNNLVVVAWLAHRELLWFPHAAALCADRRHTKCGMGGIRTTTEALPPTLYSTEDKQHSVHCNRNETALTEV